MVKAIYLNKEVMLKMLNLHDRDWKEFYIKDIFFINPGKRLPNLSLALQQNHILFMLILYLKVPLQKLLDII